MSRDLNKLVNHEGAEARHMCLANSIDELLAEIVFSHAENIDSLDSQQR